LSLVRNITVLCKPSLHCHGWSNVACPLYRLKCLKQILVF
jgi:hypothetical protein